MNRAVPDLFAYVPSVVDLIRSLHVLTCFGMGIAGTCWLVYFATGRRDWLVLAACAAGYGIVPLM